MTTNQQIGLSVGVLGALFFFTRRPAPGTATPGFGTSTIPPAAPERVRAWRDAAVDAGRIYGVSPQLILAVIWEESGGIETAIGDGGLSLGLMQVKHVAARDAGFVASTFAPRPNIQIGTAYLALQIDRMGGDVYDGLRAYNAGEAGANLGRGHDYAKRVLQKAGWR